MRHIWTKKDEQSLKDAIQECEPLLSQYEKHYSKRSWWDAVAGRLAPKILVTGRACETRFSKMKSMELPHEVPNAWDVVSERVAEYERALQEDTYDVVLRIDRMLQSICSDLNIPLQAGDSDVFTRLNRLERLLGEAAEVIAEYAPSINEFADLLNRIDNEL